MTVGASGRAHWRRRGRIAAEIAILFAALVALDRALAGGTAFVSVAPNPLWLPVVAMALAYGTGMGVVAAVLATGYWLAAAPSPPGDQLDRLLHLSLPPLMWFVAAGAIGEVTLARARRVAWLRRRATTCERQAARLGDAVEELGRINRALQVRVAAEDGTLGHLVSTAARLSASDPAARRAAIVELVTRAAGTDDFTCYLLASDGRACAWLRGDAAAVARPDALPATLAGLVRKRGGMLHVGRRADRVPLEGVGVAAVPLTHGEQMIGVLVLHALRFEALDAHGRVRLNEVGAWLGMLMAEAPRGVQRGGVGLVA